MSINESYIDPIDGLLVDPNPIPEVWSGDGCIRTNEQMQEWAEHEGCIFEEADSSTVRPKAGND